MITSKQQLNYFLECDRLALGIKRFRPSFFGDEVWKYQIAMRKLDYLSNKDCGIIDYIKKSYYKFYYHNIGIKLGFSIPFDAFGPGLAIVHSGTIVVSEYAKIGDNCRIHVGVNIGANAKQSKAAIIGNNVYIGPGAKIIGDVKIGNNVVIGANSVVVKDVDDDITIGGIPAKKISDNTSSNHIIKATELIENEYKISK